MAGKQKQSRARVLLDLRSEAYVLIVSALELKKKIQDIHTTNSKQERLQLAADVRISQIIHDMQILLFLLTNSKL